MAPELCVCSNDHIAWKRLSAEGLRRNHSVQCTFVTNKELVSAYALGAETAGRMINREYDIPLRPNYIYASE